MKINKGKKVCILTSVHPVFDTRVFHKEARTLVEAGYDVTLIAQHTKNEIVEGIKIISLPKPKNRTERFLKLDYLTYKKALREKGDIYHFHDPELLPWAFLLKKKTGAKIIYDVHEDVPKQILAKYWIPFILRFIIAHVYNLLENISIKFFDAIIAAGEDIKPKNPKIIAIKNYPFRAITTKHIDNLKTITKQFHCIYIGSISNDRCVMEILYSLYYIKNPVLFSIVGPCENKKYLSDLEKLIKKQKKSQVKLIPPLSYQKVMEYLRYANVGFILLKSTPNNIYAVSRNNKLYEYMAAGLPVIASNFPLWKEIIEGNHCGICVDPLKPEEIAKGIEYLIEHPEEAKKMGENGRKAVLEKYNWENESKKLIALYQKLLANNINEKNMDNK